MISLLSLGLATSAQAQIVQIQIPVPLAPGVQAYGRANATTLARKVPQRAATNADNYEYFIETLAE